MQTPDPDHTEPAGLTSLSLTAAVILTLLVGLALPMGIALHYGQVEGKRQAELELQRDLDRAADVLALALLEPIWQLSPDQAEPLVKSLSDDPRYVSIIVHAKGSPRAFLEVHLMAGHTGPVLSKSVPVIRQTSQLGQVTVTMSALPYLDLLHKETRRNLQATAVALGCSLAMILVLLHLRILRPMELLTAAANRLGAGRFEEPVGIHSQTEFGRVGAALESMRLSLLEAFLSQRQYSTSLEEKVAERTMQLDQARKAAEAASRAKSTFLANMSHELRTPLNGILGMTQLALRRTEDPKLKDHLGKVIQSSDHLLSVINDILDLSKIEAERLQLQHADFILADVIDNLVGVLGQKAIDKQLQLLIQLPPELTVRRFNGDPTRLTQILLNLAGNAIKFTKYGTVTVRASLAEEGQNDVLLHWEVADTGIGIEAEAQGRLFTAFEQADNSMTRKYGGTGLGLAICRQLVRLMGGEIGVRSEPGKGRTFWFTMRLGTAGSMAVQQAKDIAEESAETRLQAGFSGSCVLLAEDEPINREVSRGLLEDAGLVVHVAEDGRQALTLAQLNRYALILMDMQMPAMNGLEATQAIRADSLNKTTPILAMTANAFEEDRQACLDAGMGDHITKPVKPQKLYETLLKWLEKSGQKPEG